MSTYYIIHLQANTKAVWCPFWLFLYQSQSIRVNPSFPALCRIKAQHNMAWYQKQIRLAAQPRGTILFSHVSYIKLSNNTTCPGCHLAHQEICRSSARNPRLQSRYGQLLL